MSTADASAIYRAERRKKKSGEVTPSVLAVDPQYAANLGIVLRLDARGLDYSGKDTELCELLAMIDAKRHAALLGRNPVSSSR